MRKKRKNEFLTAFAFGPAIFSSDTKGYIITELQITNLAIINKIISGEIRGLSPEIKIRKFECSICHENFEECIHEIGELYNNVRCEVIAKDIEFTGLSIVDHPEDPRCRVTDLLLIKEDGKRKKYEWYGFKAYTEHDRFRNIQRALEKGLISEDASFCFSKFFSIKTEGKISYP